jgi:hypothetical protein
VFRSQSSREQEAIMSRSPKYTTARLARQREQELARQRAARQAARRAALEAAERAWVAAQVQRHLQSLDAVARRLDGLALPGAEPALARRVRKAGDDVGALRRQAGQAATRAAVNVLASGVAAAQRDVQRCTTDVADALAREKQQAALESKRISMRLGNILLSASADHRHNPDESVRFSAVRRSDR